MSITSVRYSILQLMMMTVLIALYYVALVNESPWWRATLMTISLCLFLNSIIASIISRGTKQAFALGYMIATFFYLMSLYTTMGIETLPLLLTQMLWTNFVIVSDTPPGETHFYIVMGLLWGQLFAFTGGLLSQRWYRQRMAGQTE